MAMVFVQLAKQVKVGYFTFTFELQKCMPETLLCELSPCRQTTA